MKSSLCECEKFMVAIMKVNDVQKKTQTMQFMLNFPSMIDEIRLGMLRFFKFYQFHHIYIIIVTYELILSTNALFSRY